jgi:hypothetical protein
MRDTNIYLREWKSSKPEQKERVKKAIDSLKWLVETFYPSDKPSMVKMRRWLQNRSELNVKREEVQQVVNTITT